MHKVNKALAEKKTICFEVSTPQRSYAGYTVYRLQLKIFDNGCSRYEFIGWKRYNDFKRLYKELKAQYPTEFKAHFPVFPKGKVFGRFDEVEIEERRRTSLSLLHFILSKHEMLTHESFQRFINNVAGHDFDCSKDPKEPNPISLNSLADELEEFNENEENVTGSNEENRAEVDLSIEDGIDDRQIWLREARSICEDDMGLGEPAANNDSNVESLEASVLFDDPLVNETASSPSSSGDESNSLDERLKNVDNSNVDESSENSAFPMPLQGEGSDFLKSFAFDERMSKRIDKTVSKDDYVFQASVAMSNAIEQEELDNHEAAFDMYKFGIGLLLRGVQGELNVERRDAVRRKTAQYLMRAEQLYKSRLQAKESCDSQVLLDDGKWRFRLSDVKVFGIIKDVMLVEKVYSKDIFVMKVLHKEGAEYKRSYEMNKKKKRPPRNLYNCPFMTKLISCVETQTGIYLLLEYVCGGRLWDYLDMPMFTRGPKRQSSISENHHSWDACDFSNNNRNVDENDNCADIINIPFKAYENGGKDTQNRKSVESVTCKIKRTLSQNSGFSEDFIRVWAAQIASALMALHSHGVVCRDLNPKNILIDGQGNIKLTYFSDIIGVDYSLDPDAVEHLYTSPEVHSVFEVKSFTDWWSYGAIIFELLMGESLLSCHPDGIDSCSIITLPKRVSNEACSLLAGLLQFNPRNRLGCGTSGIDEIKSHPFFAQIDWNHLKK